MVPRVPHITIAVGARRRWEVQGLMPGTIEDVVGRCLGLPDALVHVLRVVPFQDVRSLTCILDGWFVRMIGRVDDQGRWSHVLEIHTQASE